jgi:hypothetical protein
MGHDVVFGIQRVAESGGIEVPKTKLEAGTQFPRIHQTNICIDRLRWPFIRGHMATSMQSDHRCSSWPV